MSRPDTTTRLAAFLFREPDRGKRFAGTASTIPLAILIALLSVKESSDA